MSDNKKDTVEVRIDKKGRKYVTLPDWAVEILYKSSKIRSKKKRHVKKAIFKAFKKALLDAVKSKANENN